VSSAATNERIAADFDQVADLLESRDADVHRCRAYRAAARELRALDREVADIVAEQGRDGLEQIPAIGTRLARAIEQYVTTGRFGLLDRLLGDSSPEELFRTVPGLGEELARRIHGELGLETLEELELAAHDGRLATVPGMGQRRVRAVSEALDAMLRRSTRRRARPVRRPVDRAPPVELLLAIDRRYRELAAAGRLRTIAPRRFNPDHERWLPVWHTHEDGWDFDVLFSNTALAHELDRTRDWVVIYFHSPEGDEGQHTVVTETQGPQAGHRVVRGREHESARANAA
jgi:hypothetical protein